MKMNRPLRVMLYDDTCRSSRLGPGLTHSWIAGGALYRARKKLDLYQGFSSWDDGLAWLAEVGSEHPISEIQFWGHGKWGMALIQGQRLDVSALTPGHRWYPHLCQVRQALVGPQARWWFRTCETFGGHVGHQFATRWANFFGCKASGHTFIIGPWQSGLHTLSPGQSPDWSPEEGILEGDADDPRRASWSKQGAPNTISCLTADVPAAFDSPR